MKEDSFFTYIVKCADGSLYTGWTTDVERRLEAHNSGKGAKYTRNRGPVMLLASWKFASKVEAMQAEYAIKKLSRKKKLELLLVAN